MKHRQSRTNEATNSMANATHFKLGTEAASWSSRPCNGGRCALSSIHPNASRHGPPTSSPVFRNNGTLRMTTTRVQGFLTEDERERLLAEEAPDYVRLILMLGFFDGLRDGVMLAANAKWLWISCFLSVTMC